MCVAGGRRCPGSGTPSAKQRAKRKANTAYRKAVADEIEKTTGDAGLAKKVRNLPMTDVADVVTAARLDADSIAKSAGQASYTDKDGHITTVDVKPAGTTRRSPISKEAMAVLAEVDDKVGAFEEGTAFHHAVLNGDRVRQDELRAEAAEDINAAAEEYGNTSLWDLKDHEVDEAIEKYQKLVDEAYACTDDHVVQAKAEEMLRVTKDVQKSRDAAFHGHPLSALNDPTQLDDLEPATDEDSARKLAQDMYDRLEHLDPAELSDADLEELHDKWDELDESIRAHTDDISAHETTGNAGIGLVEEIEFREQSPEDKYEFGDDYQRVRALEEWAAGNPDHPAASVIEGNPSDKELSKAAKWARDVLDEDKPEASEMDKGIARTVFAKEDEKFLKEHRRDVMGKKYSDDTRRYLDTLEDFYTAAENGTMPYEDNAQIKKDIDNLRAHQRAFYGADPEANADKVVSHTFHGDNLDDMPLGEVKAMADKHFMKALAHREDKDIEADSLALSNYVHMRSSLENFEKATRGLEDDIPTSAQDAADLHWRTMLYAQDVFDSTEDPHARAKALDAVDLTRKRARERARSARSLHGIPSDCWPNNTEGRDFKPGFYASRINEFEHLSKKNSPSFVRCGFDTPWGSYSSRGSNIEGQQVFVSKDKTGASSVIRIHRPAEPEENFNSAAHEAFYFSEIARAQREIETTGKRDVTIDNRENYDAFTRVYADLDTKKKGNPAAQALVRTSFSMSHRGFNGAYESERQEWKESADTLRQAVGTNPYDNDEDNAMFDSMCTQAAETYEYELDRLEKLQRGH